MSTSLPARISIPPEVLVRVLEDESVLLNLDSEHYYGLDDIGTRMWQLLAENGGVTALVEQLLVEYDVDEATLRRDLANLIAELAEAGLIAVDQT